MWICDLRQLLRTDDSKTHLGFKGKEWNQMTEAWHRDNWAKVPRKSSQHKEKKNKVSEYTTALKQQQQL